MTESCEAHAGQPARGVPPRELTQQARPDASLPGQRSRGRRWARGAAVPLGAVLRMLAMLAMLAGVLVVLAAVFSPSAGAAGGCGGG